VDVSNAAGADAVEGGVNGAAVALGACSGAWVLVMSRFLYERCGDPCDHVFKHGNRGRGG